MAICSGNPLRGTFRGKHKLACKVFYHSHQNLLKMAGFRASANLSSDSVISFRRDIFILIRLPKLHLANRRNP